MRCRYGVLHTLGLACNGRETRVPSTSHGAVRCEHSVFASAELLGQLAGSLQRGPAQALAAVPLRYQCAACALVRGRCAGALVRPAGKFARPRWWHSKAGQRTSHTVVGSGPAQPLFLRPSAPPPLQPLTQLFSLVSGRAAISRHRQGPRAGRNRPPSSPSSARRGMMRKPPT